MSEQDNPTGGCGCGAPGSGEEFDARLIPPMVRHAAIMGAVSAIHPGCSIVLVAPHDPVPLLAGIAQAHGDAIAATYVERGPEAWKVRLERTR